MFKNNWIKVLGLFLLVLFTSLWLERHNDVRGQDCQQPASVPACSGNDATICSGCTSNQFCCPKSSPGGCNDSFENLCEFTDCNSNPGSICQIPPPPPVRTTRNLTFINNCDEPIWVGGSADGGLSSENSGFALAAKGDTGHQKMITVPGNLQSANFWPRTSCTFPCTSTPCCQTGDCGKTSIECNGGTKSAPANSFEVTFNESPGNDFYDITNVDGYTVGIAVQQANGIKISPDPTINGVPAPQLNCGNPTCTNFDMMTCPPELSQTTDSGTKVCWGLGGAANNAGQRSRDTSGVLSDIAKDCNELALVGAACGAESTDGTTCGTSSLAGCADSSSLFCCSPFNDQLPDPHGGIGCADATDPNYVNTCSGVWPTPDATWCTQAGVPNKLCTYNGVFENQCPQAYSWQFNDSNSTYQCINPDYKITFCPSSSNVDQDALLDFEDSDSDNDGIPDASESGDSMSMKNGIRVRGRVLADPDGDGIPNEFDLDSDGDGICDLTEAGGVDEDRDCVADDFTDSDKDGLNDQQNPDLGGTPLPLPDTDNDGVPDFLDTDSDNDGVVDTNETVGGMDVDGDGILDDSEDLNKDGLADSVDPHTGTPLEFLDSDGDGIFDHLDVNDNTGQGGGGCSIAATGAKTSMPLYLLIPLFIAIRRAWGKTRGR
jgi:hypothetical protein